jgi:hypothetical protein
MAKKPRTPDPPRKVQAPKVRQKQPSSGGGRGIYVSQTNLLIGLGLIAIAVLIAGLFIVAGRGGGGGANVTPGEVKAVRTAMAVAGCTFTASTADPAQRHMTSANEHVTYKTFPPASGVHNPTPAIWGNYRVAADPRQAVHNLEHGGIVIWYGAGISAANRSALDTFYEKSPNAVIITPIADRYPNVTYPKHKPIDGHIAMSVWTVDKKTGTGTVYVAECPTYNEKAFTQFRNAFRGKGPEPFPVSSLTPGT